MSPTITITCTYTVCTPCVYYARVSGRKRCQKRRRFEITSCPLFLEADVRVHDVYFMVSANATGSVRSFHNVILIFSQRTWTKLNVFTIQRTANERPRHLNEKKGGEKVLHVIGNNNVGWFDSGKMPQRE